MNTKSTFFNNEKQQGQAYSQKLSGIKKLNTLVNCNGQNLLASDIKYK